MESPKFRNKISLSAKGNNAGGQMRFTPALRPVPIYQSPNI